MSTPITKKIKQEFVEDAYSHLQSGCQARGRAACRCFREEIQGEKNSSGCGISVRRTAKGLEYNCFKASCDLGGGIAGFTDAGFRGTGHVFVSDSERPAHSQGVLQQLALPAHCEQGVSEHRRDWLSQFSFGAVEIARYGITESRLDRSGIYFPVYGLAGNYRGYLRRETEVRNAESGGADARPKWVSHLEGGTVYFSRPYKPRRIVFIVEDVLSVIRLGKTDYNACALLGTTLSKDQLPTLLQYLTKVQAPKVVIALDPDATDKAKKIQKVLTEYWKGVNVMETTADPKWWSDEQIERINCG